MKYLYSLLVLLILPLHNHGQIGGSSTYAFLSLPNSARIASLGGELNAFADGDLNLAFSNPSLLAPGMSGNLVANYVNYFADINYGYVSYARDLEKKGMFAAGINYFNYGEFVEADETGLITGTFKAADYALNIIYSRRIDSSFTFGVNVKPIYSQYERYASFGLATDLGITYKSDNRLFAAAFVVRNLGTQLKGYTAKNHEPLPLDIQFGISQKLEHAPFRFSLVAHHLQKIDLTYEKPGSEQNEFNTFGEPDEKSKFDEIGDKIMRHFIMGVEFTPLQNFYLRLGYNYRRRQELKIDSRVAMVGFSWGFGIKISKFHVNYGRATYHLAGASNHFSISTSLSEF
jgi:hypothetical protein